MANAMRLTLHLTAIDNMSRVVAGAMRNSVAAVQAAQVQSRQRANDARGEMMDAGMMGASAGMALAYPLKMAANYERLRVQMNILTGSVQEGGRAYAAVLKLARDTPLTLTEVATGQTRLMGYGQSARDAAASLKMLGDITSVTQGDLNGAIVAYGQARQEGRLLTRDLGQFVNSGVPIYTMLRRVVGEGANIKKMAEEGQISFALLQRAMEESTRTGGQFANGLDIQAQTLQGTWVKFTDSLEQTAAAFGTSMIPAAKALLTPLMSILGYVQRLVERFPILGQVTMTLVGVFTALSFGAFMYYGAIFAANSMMGKLIITSLRFPFTLLMGGFRALNWSLYGTVARMTMLIGATKTFFLTSIPAFVMGIGTAIMSVNAWTASFLGLSASFYGIPIIGWILAVVAAIIAIGVAIYKNWDTISVFFSGMWTKFTEFLPKAKAWGHDLVTSIKSGIVSGAPTLFAALDGVVKFARGFFPASPAKRGAFKDLHRIKIIEQVASAVRPNALSSALGRATEAATSAMGVGNSPALMQSVGGGTVQISYNPTINFGAGSEGDKQGFLDILNSHKEEMARMVRESMRSNERKRF